MKSKRIVSAILAVALASSGFAFAQGHGNGNGNGNGRERGGHQQAQGEARQNARGDAARQSNRRDERGRGNQVQVERRDERGAGPDHEFRRGGRLPSEYRNRQYVVDDWRGHQLSAPPRGYHWVQAGGDYVLVAIATGIIMQLLLNH